METIRQIQTAHETLAALLRGGRLPHALLIEGPAPGALELARRAAQGAVCSGEPKPCGVCRDCRKAEKEIHPDILSYGGEGGARSFHIDTVREIRREAYVLPGEAPRKALLLKDAQNLSVQAQNALLKIMEEPPKSAVFILTCDNRSALLETVLSRVTVLSLAAPEGADGSDSPEEKALDILGDICIGSELAALAALSSYERNRTGLLQLVGAMRGILAGLLLEEEPSEPRRQRLGRRLSRLQLLRIIAIMDETARDLSGNVNGLLLCTTICSKIRSALEGGAV